ncbi:neutral zinc metallopeptidase [Sphaerisporangium aureirubrum]|uniref:Neutral zinc metallopeptidase n=1 Tax=Sphaerisporangium aureirubrum TaxID=1544736 RepID=A0ABW1NWG4_9ACTN
MGKSSVVLLLAIAASLLAGGTAHAAPASSPALPAYPVKNASTLTRNALYATGRLPATSCPEHPVRAGSAASVRSYLLPLVKCLDATWKAQFAKARLPFTPPKVRFITRPEKACGEKWGKNVQAIYCNPTRQIVMLLDRAVVSSPEDLFLMDVIAHEYGHHVQNVTGMWRELGRLPSRGKAEYYEQTRRHELQAECLAGAFIGSVWQSLDRTDEDWDDLLDIDRRSGDEQSKVRDHGKGRNIANWLNRGYKAAGPSACNTWIASSTMVA